MGPGEVQVVVLLLLALLPSWLSLRDVRRQPSAAWRAAGVSRPAAFALVLLPVVGPALWLRRLRPRLRSAPR